MENISFNKNKIEKPLVLYHGSYNKNIQSFEPRADIFDGEKGEYVFASPSYKAALIHMNEGFSFSAGIYGKNEFAVFPMTREEFINKDKGGAVYVLDPQKFHSTKKRSVYEWVSEESVTPIEKEEFGSVLSAMEAAGVKIYFLGSNKEYKNYLSKSPSDRQAYLASRT